MSSEDDLPPRDRWARLRFAIIGPLPAAPPVVGELHEALTLLAAKTWRHPFTGLDVRFGVSTIERWLYAAKKAADPVRDCGVGCGATSVASRVYRPRRLRR